MQLEFTPAEAAAYLGAMKKDSEVVRLVDPVGRTVLSEAGKVPDELVVCNKIWGRCERCENCTSLRALQTRGQAYKLEMLQGRTYWVHSRCMSVEGRLQVAEIVQDVTESFLMDTDQRDRLGKLVTSYNQMLITDSLTGVYNRRFLDEHFIPSLACCHEEGLTVNLAFIDMDDFKLVNDRYGHNAGDRLLCDVAGFWKLHFDAREKGRERLVVRYGGDEILILACGISGREFTQEIERCNSEMRKVCYVADELHFRFDFTVGIGSSEDLGADWTWEELVALADRRMYSGKPGRELRDDD